MGKIKQLNVAAGTLEFITPKEFLASERINKKIEKIYDAFADAELLGSPTLPDFGLAEFVVGLQEYPDGDIFSGYVRDDFETEMVSWVKKTIILPEVDLKNLDKFMEDQIKGLAHFFKDRREKPKTPQDIAEICEDLSVASLENFGNPTHLIEFDDGTYIVVDPEAFECRVAVKDGIIRAGLIPLKRTIFGLRTE